MKNMLAIMLATLVIFTSCTKQDLDDIRKNLSEIKDNQTSINVSIASLRSIIMALEKKDYVTSVTPLSDGSGYVINFQNSGSVTIRNGEKGETPIIGTAQFTDGRYYWTVDGTWMLNLGEKVPVTGDAPMIRINSKTGMWEISTDRGVEWTSTGVKAQGDAIFAKEGIDNSHPDYVTLTLAGGGTKIRLVRYKAINIGANIGTDIIGISTSEITSMPTTIPLELPSGFKASDYTAIIAQIKSNIGESSDIKTRAATTTWGVAVNKPTFTAGVYNNDASVTVTPPVGVDGGETAILEVSIMGSNGTVTKLARLLVAYTKFTFLQRVGSVTITNYSGNLTDIYIPYYFSNNPITILGDHALWGLSSLVNVSIPNSVESIEEEAFGYCTALKTVFISGSVKNIGEGAFYQCVLLTEVTIESITPPSLGIDAFRLTSAELVIRVPMSSLSAYKTHDAWKEYSSRIVGY